jgi:hypothetical protein
MYSNQ